MITSGSGMPVPRARDPHPDRDCRYEKMPRAKKPLFAYNPPELPSGYPAARAGTVAPLTEIPHGSLPVRNL